MKGDQGLHHSAGLLWMMDKMALISMLSTREVVDVGRRKKPPSVGGRGQPPISAWSREGTHPAGGSGGIPCAFAAVLANREDIDPTLGDQRPPYKPPDLPHCYASDLKAPWIHKEAMRSEHAHVWEDSTAREFYGLRDAEAFEPV